MIMKIKSLLILLIIFSHHALACTSILKKFPLECELQDRYKMAQKSFQEEFNINLDDLIGVRGIRLIARKDLEVGIQKGKKVWEIYDPAPLTWLKWEKGERQKTLLQEKLTRTNHVQMTRDDLIKLHKSTINQKLIGWSSVILGGARPGFMRSRFYHLPPSFIFNCEDKKINR